MNRYQVDQTSIVKNAKQLATGGQKELIDAYIKTNDFTQCYASKLICNHYDFLECLDLFYGIDIYA